MKYVELGKNKEKISAIGLGTWQFGSPGWGYGREFDRSTAIKLINLALDMGVNLFDTAEMYGRGLSETILGEAIKGRRDETFIATKVSPHHLRYRSLKRSAERSLNRLGIKTIDLYQIHWPNTLISLKVTIKALDELVDEGKIRYVGVSNFSKGFLNKARALSKHEIVSNQLNYSLAKLDVEKNLLPYAKEAGVKIIAFSPLGQGVLTGKYTPEKGLTYKGVRAINILFSPQNLEKLQPLINKMKEIGENYGKTPAQIALNYLISDDSVITIPGAKNEEQLKSNIQAADFNMKQTEIDELKEIAGKFHPQRMRSLPWILGFER